MTASSHNSRPIGITFKTTERIGTALARRAAERGVTQRRILHEGLRAIGFEITEEDLIDRRGRPSKSKDTTAGSGSKRQGP